MASQIKVDTITDQAGTGAPNFTNGATIASASGTFYFESTFTLAGVNEAVTNNRVTRYIRNGNQVTMWFDITFPAVLTSISLVLPSSYEGGSLGGGVTLQNTGLSNFSITPSSSGNSDQFTFEKNGSTVVVVGDLQNNRVAGFVTYKEL